MTKVINPKTDIKNSQFQADIKKVLAKYKATKNLNDLDLEKNTVNNERDRAIFQAILNFERERERGVLMDETITFSKLF